MHRWLLYFVLLFSSQAFAFGDDLCFSKEETPNTPKINNCLDVTPKCLDPKTQKPVDNFECRASLIKSVSGIKKRMEGSRSMLHTDATYFLAQALGYSPEAAYTIIMYNQATDLGVYQPFDKHGYRLVPLATCEQSHYAAANCQYMSQNINGLVRLNFSSAGHTLHLPGRYYKPGEEVKPIPFPYDYIQDREHEIVIAQYYDWLYDKIPSTCVGGITQSGTAVEKNQTALCGQVKSFPAQSRLDWRFPIQLEWDLIGIINKKRFSSVSLGEQILREFPDGKPEYYSHDLDKIVGAKNVSLAKLGIFLHLLQDRYSHHLCSDNSQIYEKTPGKFSIDYNSTYCKQGPHLVGHLWEIGMQQNLIPPEYRTMAPALAASYDVLRDYGKTHQQLTNTAINLNKNDMVNKLVAVLEIQNPQQRLLEMTQLFNEYKLQPLPGHEK